MHVQKLFANKIAKRSFIAVLIAIFFLLIEVFAFNYRFYPSRGESFVVNKFKVLDSDITLVEHKEDKDIYKIDENVFPILKIEFDEPTEVNTIAPFIDFENIDVYRYEMKVTGYVIDGTRAYPLTTDHLLECVYEADYTRYYQPEFNQKVDYIIFEFTSLGNLKKPAGLKFSYSGFGFNFRMPFHFSIIRYAILTLGSLGIYGIVLLFLERAKKLKGVPKEQILRNILKWCIYCLPIIGVIIVYAVYGGFSMYFYSETGTQISKGLVDAFIKGHVYLDTEPSPELLALENPYDPSARSGISFLWDHLLYNGKYYSYYGIAPVFMIFLPFKLITGYYFGDGPAVLLFTIIGLFFMALSYETLIKNMATKRSIPSYLKYSLFLLLGLGCGALFQVTRPYFYEVSTSSAFMCMMIALFHISKSGLIYKIENNKWQKYHFVMASLWLSLAVLSRATTILYALMHLILLGFYFYHNYKEMDKKDIILFFVLSLVPYLVFGSIQCVYNYLRFGNIFDFGIEYSLTIADFKHMPFHFGNVLTSLYNFMFAPPIYVERAYFLYGNNVRFGSAYYFFETSSSIGLIYRMPIILCLLLFPFLISYSKKERIEHIFTRWLPCVVIPFVQVILTWQSGFATRYYTDFAWPLMFFAIFTFIRFYDEKMTTKNSDLYVLIFLCVHLVFSTFVTTNMVAVYVPMLTHYSYVYHDYAYTRNYYYIARELMFWR